MRHVFPGLKPTVLGSYLATLGLGRVLAQGDPETVYHWAPEGVVVITAVEDVPSFLVDSYRPTPILSPWNGGSGFGPKDKAQRVALERLTTSTDPRLSEFKLAAHAATLGVEAISKAKPGYTKAELVTYLRNWLPPSSLPWLDAAIVLVSDGKSGQEAVFPVLLGSGGNDGRLEFSSNFHQRLADVLPPLGAKAATSRGWALDLLTGGATTPLKGAAIGQFDGLGAGGPNTSVLDDADSLTNPWQYILMLEGVLHFASSPARALGPGRARRARAAMPFTVNGGAGGPQSGAEGENVRGEVWAPVWSKPLRQRQVSSIFTQAKAVWDGQVATQPAHMYAALRSHGVDESIARFERFQIAERNGLAFVAAHVDSVRVRASPEIEVARQIERRFAGYDGITGGRWDQLRNSFNRNLITYTRDPGLVPLLDVLGSLTAFERAVAQSGPAMEKARVASHLPQAQLVAGFLDKGRLAALPEVALAAGIASARVMQAPQAKEEQQVKEEKQGEDGQTIRDLLIGRPPTRGESAWEQPVIMGATERPLVDVLADLAVWRSQHWDSGDSGASIGLRYVTGHSYGDWELAHQWCRGELDEALLRRAVLGLISLDWTGFTAGAEEPDKRIGHQASTRPAEFYADVLFRRPLPELALLQAFATGRVLVPGAIPPADRRDLESQTAQGMRPDWAARLRSGQPTQTSSVIKEALLLFSRCRVLRSRNAGVSTHVTLGPIEPTTPGARLLAALFAPAALTPVQALATSVLHEDSESQSIPTEGEHS